MGWRDLERVWAVGHVNPATSMYFEWNAASGELLAEAAGSRFTVSPDRRSVAHLENVPLGAPAPFDRASLIIDGNTVWPVDSRYHRVAGALMWSADSRSLAFVDRVEESTEVVVLDRDGKVRSNVPVRDDVQMLGWTPDALMIADSDEQAWSVTNSGAVKSNLAAGKVQVRSTLDPCRPSSQ